MTGNGRQFKHLLEMCIRDRTVSIQVLTEVVIGFKHLLIKQINNMMQRRIVWSGNFVREI